MSSSRSITAFLTDLFTSPVPLDVTAPHSMDECKALLMGLKRKETFIRLGLRVGIICSDSSCSFWIDETGSKATIHVVGQFEETDLKTTLVRGQITSEILATLLGNCIFFLVLIIGVGIEGNAPQLILLAPILVGCIVLALAAMVRVFNRPRETAFLNRIKWMLLTP